MSTISIFENQNKNNFYNFKNKNYGSTSSNRNNDVPYAVWSQKKYPTNGKVVRNHNAGNYENTKNGCT